MLICTSLNLIYQWVNEPWRVGVNQGVLQTKAHESSGDATPRLTSVLFWAQSHGNGMVFIKVKSPEPRHSCVCIHNHNSQHLLILNYALLMCISDGQSLSQVRVDNFPGAQSWKHFYLRPFILTCIYFTLLSTKAYACWSVHTQMKIISMP